MPASPVSHAQAQSLRQASAKAMDAARELLASSERQAFDVEESITLIAETLGTVLAVFPTDGNLITRAVMNANFGLLTPAQAKRAAGFQQ